MQLTDKSWLMTKVLGKGVYTTMLMNLTVERSGCVLTWSGEGKKDITCAENKLRFLCLNIVGTGDTQ